MTTATQTLASHEQPTAPGSRRTYVLAFLVVSCALLLALFFVLPTEWFAARSGDPYLINLNYAATLQHADCELLLYGDSSAEVGLLPSVLEQRTGLRTCNIAEPISVAVLNGTSVLDQYLAHNAPPRILLFFYNAANLNPSHYPDEIALFEGVTYRMRQPHRLSFVLKHPILTSMWLREGTKLLWHHHPAAQATRADTKGRLALPGNPRIACTPLRMPPPPDPAWVNTLRTHYGSKTTRVVVDVMPIADCDTRFDTMQKQLGTLTDNKLSTLPVTNFLEVGPHTTNSGAEVLSQQVANQLFSIH